MTEKLCFLCGKNLGFFNELYSINEIQKEKVTAPSDMKKDDRICTDCFNHRKEVERNTIRESQLKYASLPTSLLYFAPLFLAVLGGILMYIAVKEQDQEMANKGMALGVVITFIEIIIVFSAWSSIMSAFSPMGM